MSSTGRTGTQFLADRLEKMLTGCRGFHEPGTPWLSKPHKWLDQIKRFGLYHMTVGQLSPSNSMFKLSTERCTGRIREDQVRKNIIKMRKGLINSIDKEIYLEASGHLFGTLDLIADIIPEANFVYIIRDPRYWIKSALNTYEYILYGPLDPEFLNLSIKASDFPEDKYYDRWDQMSMFERYCWYYNKVNSFVMERMIGRKNLMILRYEDLFGSREFFTEMLNFISRFNNGFKTSYSYQPELMNKVHSNSKKKEISEMD
ncbi:MAG: hypothetical protein ACOC4G_11120 [Bacillota bacterium]